MLCPNEKSVDEVKRETEVLKVHKTQALQREAKCSTSPGAAPDSGNELQDSCMTLNFLRATL